MTQVAEKLPGAKKSQFSVTLLNYMEPKTANHLGLKDDPKYGMGKVSVSWHCDSSLQDFSTIGVYQLTQGPCDWRIAVRDPENEAVSPLVSAS